MAGDGVRELLWKRCRKQEIQAVLLVESTGSKDITCLCYLWLCDLGQVTSLSLTFFIYSMEVIISSQLTQDLEQLFVILFPFLSSKALRFCLGISLGKAAYQEA